MAKSGHILPLIFSTGHMFYPVGIESVFLVGQTPQIKEVSLTQDAALTLPILKEVSIP